MSDSHSRLFTDRSDLDPKKNSVACSPQANYTDRAAAGC
jgi:hypothetical protein